jgi:hypothetical protein
MGNKMRVSNCTLRTKAAAASKTLPFQHFDFVFQRLFFALQRSPIDALDGDMILQHLIHLIQAGGFFVSEIFPIGGQDVGWRSGHGQVENGVLLKVRIEGVLADWRTALCNHYFREGTTAITWGRVSE